MNDQNKKDVGIWIDHRKTVIVSIQNEVEVTREIKSNMEKHVRFSSGSRSKGLNGLSGSTAEDIRDRQYGDHLGRYYEGIISLIRDADTIYIFGPGEAKVELETLLKKGGLGERIIGLESADKMTNNQVAAKVRVHYQSKGDY